MVEALERSIADFDAQIEATLAPFRGAVDQLITIPGVSRRAAEVVVAEIGVDMHRFPTVGHLLSWATNDTHYISFRKLIRSDGGAAATAVRDDAAQNPVAVAIDVATEAQGAANASTEPENRVPAALQAKNPAGYQWAMQAHNKKVQQWQNNVNAVLAAHGMVITAAAEARNVAGNAAANPTSAAQVKPFVDAMTDMMAGAEGLLRALKVVDEGKANALVARLDAAKDASSKTGLCCRPRRTAPPRRWAGATTMCCARATRRPGRFRP